MIERKDCPYCGYSMDYIYPSDHPDPDIDEALNRLQECRNTLCNIKHGRYQGDVLTGQQHTFRRTDRDGYSIDGKVYSTVGEWVSKVLLKGDAK